MNTQQQSHALSTTLSMLDISVPLDCEEGNVNCPIPSHKDSVPSMSVNLTKGVWYCHGCKVGGTAKHLYMHCREVNEETAKVWYERMLYNLMNSPGAYRLSKINSINRSQGSSMKKAFIPKYYTAKYKYLSTNGTLLGVVYRTKDKQFFPAWLIGGEYYTKIHDGLTYPLYNSNHIARRPEASVWIVEGEKDANTLSKLNLLSTTNFGGINRWNKTDWRILKGRDVILWPDNDKAGREGFKGIRDTLEALPVNSIKVVKVESKDATDYLKDFRIEDITYE